MRLDRKKHRRLRRDLSEARTYNEWQETAQALDRLEGNDEWREDPTSPHYDYELVGDHLRSLKTLRQRGDIPALRDLLEESLHRNLGDLSNQALYEYAYAGTKRLIEDYLDEIAATLHWVCDTPIPGYPDEAKLTLARAAFRVFGRSALILSGGGALGLFHLGVVKSLWEEDLLPDVISGASMGAIIAGGTCVRSDRELTMMWENVEGIHRRATRLQNPLKIWRTQSLLSPEQLYEHISTNLGDRTFSEAYAHSGRVLNIAVSPTRHRQKPRLLNYLTSPDVLINHAATASCSLPALFPPSQLMRRHEDGSVSPYVEDERWVDGSLHGDVPTMRLSRLHNVNHYIVSQANPHILPFAKLENRAGVLPATADLVTSSLRAQGRQTLNLARRRLNRPAWRQTLEWAHALAHQNYSGDINIHPHFRLTDYTRVMKNPSLEELRAFIRAGERSTWPQLAMIRNQTRVSRVMAQTIRRVEVRIAERGKPAL